jgi:hypothetical protein
MYRIFTMYWTALQWYAHIQILRRRYIGSRPPKRGKLAHLRSMRYIGIRSLPDEAIWQFPFLKLSSC